MDRPKKSPEEVRKGLARAMKEGIVDGNRELAKSMALHRPNKTEEEIFQALMRNENP